MTTARPCDLVRADYEEMPGLCLTERQLQRPWHLDRTTCEEVVRRLVSEGLLSRAPGDEYRHGSRVS